MANITIKDFKFPRNGNTYFVPQVDDTLSIEGASADAKKTGDEIGQLKSEFTAVDEELTLISGSVLPPPYAIGARYVSNGVDTWTNNTIRMSFAKGTYAKLKQGDVVARNTTAISYFIGGYSTDDGATFTAISGTYDSYTVPADGLYFFCLVKQGDATFTENDLENAWSYLKITRSDNSMEDRLEDVEQLSEVNASNTADIKDAIDFEIAPITPTAYYDDMTDNTGLNYLGNAVADTGQEASDYIDMTNIYDICRIVSSTSLHYGLGLVCYYKSDKTFIRRDTLGADYDFTSYNGQIVAWLGIDKTVPNAKYLRFCGVNGHDFKYWIVYNGPKASILDSYKKYPLLGKKIVNFGDSIFGITRPPKDISSYLAMMTGATVYNCGFGGCEMSTHADSNYNPFSMCNLATAIATDTWTDQETAAAASGMPAYFADTVTLLESIDFSKIDIVTIAYGTNDWNNGSPLDNGGNADKQYFADAMRYSIETLLTAFPNLHIFVCTPIYRCFLNASYEFIDDTTTHENSHGLTLGDFIEKTVEVAKEYLLPVIDNYNIGMNRYNRLTYFPSTDGAHPKPEGNQLIASHIAKELFIFNA